MRRPTDLLARGRFALPREPQASRSVGRLTDQRLRFHAINVTTIGVKAMKSRIFSVLLIVAASLAEDGIPQSRRDVLALLVATVRAWISTRRPMVLAPQGKHRSIGVPSRQGTAHATGA